MSGKVGYYTGVLLGILFIYGLLALGVYGIFSSIVNKEVPYAPIILILSVFMFRKLSQIQLFLELNARIQHTKQRISEIDNDVQRMMTRVARNGRGN